MGLVWRGITGEAGRGCWGGGLSAIPRGLTAGGGLGSGLSGGLAAAGNEQGQAQGERQDGICKTMAFFQGNSNLLFGQRREACYRERREQLHYNTKGAQGKAGRLASRVFL